MLISVSFIDFFPEFAQALDRSLVERPVDKTSPSDNSGNKKSLDNSTILVDEEVLLKEGKFDEVIASLAPKISELSPRKLKILGRAYGGNKNTLLAVKALNLALGKNSKDVEASTLLGWSFLQGKDREAMINFREAAKNNPKYEPAYLGMEKVYTKKGNKYELRMLYVDMIEMMGEQARFVTRLCELYVESNLFVDSKTTCARGMSLKTDEPKNYIGLARTMAYTGEKDAARNLFRLTTEKFKNSDEAQLAYAEYLDSEKNYTESATFYKNALEANPQSLRALRGWALASLEMQKYHDTYIALERSCRIDRRSIKEVKRVMGTLHTTRENDWYEKFILLSESCGLPTQDSKSTK